MQHALSSIRNRTIFLTALDWGLGHATRCVPLIRQLMANNRIILGMTPGTEAIFKQEFPELTMIAMPPYDIRYSERVPLLLKLMADAPRIRRVIAEEHQHLKTIVAQHKVDLVISDNRFGCYHQDVESIYITHQLHLQAGIWSGIADRIHRHYIQSYSRVWVPDHEDRQLSLAGRLSDKADLDLPIEYIGPLSRLQVPLTGTDPSDVLILLSGVEPQRSLLEKMLCRAFSESSGKAVLVRGSTTTSDLTFPEQLRVIDLAGAGELSALIRNARTIVSRSGYSTLMDLHAFGKKELVLIPTPGQTEQEYLARYWCDRFGATLIPQREVHHWKP